MHHQFNGQLFHYAHFNFNLPLFSPLSSGVGIIQPMVWCPSSVVLSSVDQFVVCFDGGALGQI
jgi:hypothetical protein